MFEVWQWVTLGILWASFAVNIYCAVLYRRMRRKLWQEVEQYRKTVGKLIVRDDEVVGLLDGKETGYISKDLSKIMRNLARRHAVSEFYDAITFLACDATLVGKSDDYVDGFCAAVDWYNGVVDKVKKDMLGEIEEDGVIT